MESVRGGMLHLFTLIELSGDEVDATEFLEIVFEASRLETCEHPKLTSLLESEEGFYRGRVSRKRRSSHHSISHRQKDLHRGWLTTRSSNALV